MKPYQPKYTIKDMQNLATLRGGKCLSKEYWDYYTKLSWQCEMGHTWDETPLIIEQGAWCPQCTKPRQNNKLSINDFHNVAKDHNGKCLSKKYKNLASRLKFQCKDGHIFETSASIVRYGSWCPKCAGVAKLSMTDMHRLAKNKNGKCLSKKYININTKLKWQCSKGHIWNTAPSNVRNGNWCPVCSGKQMHTIGKMHVIAEKHGGKCLSEEYVSTKTKLKWQCVKGHIWETPPSVVMNGAWCPACAGLRKLTIEEMQEMAEKRGGKCLSKKYINIGTKLKWQCNKGHKWKTTPGEIRSGYWCPHCAGNAKLTIGVFHKIAKKNGGECLSAKYNGIESPLKFKCKKGHIWDTNAHFVRYGSWCPYCAGTRRLTIEDMHETAKKHDGKCLSEIYVNDRVKLKWRCSKGHIWETTPSIIRRGHWCPVCSNDIVIQSYEKKRGTIEEMQQIASGRNGKCLSVKYVSSQTKLKWQCKNGHIWEAIPAMIKYGQWCPVCALDIIKEKRIKYSIDKMQKIADRKGGKCLSEKYVNFSSKLKWQCAKGHVWEAVPGGIIKGQWCKKCSTDIVRKKLTAGKIEEMKAVAEKKGGLCLSDRYINNKTKLRFQCKKGHVWEGYPNSIKKNTWCPTCKAIL